MALNYVLNREKVAEETKRCNVELKINVKCHVMTPKASLPSKSFSLSD